MPLVRSTVYLKTSQKLDFRLKEGVIRGGTDNWIKTSRPAYLLKRDSKYILLFENIAKYLRTPNLENICKRFLLRYF